MGAGAGRQVPEEVRGANLPVVGVSARLPLTRFLRASIGEYAGKRWFKHLKAWVSVL